MVIVDYRAGNLRSVQRACRRVRMEAGISSDPDAVRGAERVIFPGVGSAVSAVGTLAETGLGEAVVEFYRTGRPLLGICLGLQIALDSTAEGGRQCLGLVPGGCERLAFADAGVKVPQIGWNGVEFARAHPMLRNSQSGDEFYFVHSYYAQPADPAHALGFTDYGGLRFASILARDNFFATQFHLEKSGELGLRMLAAFADWKP